LSSFHFILNQQHNTQRGEFFTITPRISSNKSKTVLVYKQLNVQNLLFAEIGKMNKENLINHAQAEELNMESANTISKMNKGAFDPVEEGI
jgi:hypothetical protein